MFHMLVLVILTLWIGVTTAMLASLALNVVFVTESADVSNTCLVGSHSS